MGFNEIWNRKILETAGSEIKGRTWVKHDQVLLKRWKQTYRMQVLSQARLTRSMLTDKKISLLSCDVGSETSGTVVAPH